MGEKEIFHVLLHLYTLLSLTPPQSLRPIVEVNGLHALNRQCFLALPILAVFSRGFCYLRAQPAFLFCL
jgi:hypothetical protein